MPDKCTEAGFTGIGRFVGTFHLTTNMKLSNLANKAVRFAEVGASRNQAKRKLECDIERPKKKEQLTRSVSVRLVLDCVPFSFTHILMGHNATVFVTLTLLRSGGRSFADKLSMQNMRKAFLWHAHYSKLANFLDSSKQQSLQIRSILSMQMPFQGPV